MVWTSRRGNNWISLKEAELNCFVSNICQFDLKNVKKKNMNHLSKSNKRVAWLVLGSLHYAKSIFTNSILIILFKSW